MLTNTKIDLPLCRSATPMATRRFTAQVMAVLALLLVFSSVPSRSADRKAAQAVRLADRLLKKVPALPTRKRRYADDMLPRIDLKEAEAAFNDVIAKYGGSPRAYVGLGQCRMRLGDYEGSVNAFARALKLSPSDTGARQGYRRARRFLEIAHAARRQLPKEHRILQLLEMPVRKGNGVWLVLSERFDPSGDDGDVRLTLFRRTRLGCLKVWQSKSIRDTRHEGYEIIETEVYFLNPAIRRAPLVAIWEVFPAGSYEPSYVQVFEWRRGRMTKIFGVTSNWPIWIDDLNHDGICEIGNYYEIGQRMCHAEQFLWTDIYAYKHGGYVLANRDFPKAFRGWTKRLRAVLKKRPDDPEILEYLGIVHEIQRHPKAALAAYRYAERHCSDHYYIDEVNELDWHGKSLLADIQSRIRSVSRKTE